MVIAATDLVTLLRVRAWKRRERRRLIWATDADDERHPYALTPAAAAFGL